MDVLVTLLEHGGAGRLPLALRGAGAVRVTYETRRQACLCTILAGTGRTEAEQVEALLRRELEFVVSKAIPAREIELAKRLLHGAYALDNEPYGGQAGSLGYYASIDSWNFAAEYLEKINAVTPDQVQQAAARYLNPEHSVAVLLKGRGAPAQPPRTDA